jgi:hypothetical protein
VDARLSWTREHIGNSAVPGCRRPLPRKLSPPDHEAEKRRLLGQAAEVSDGKRNRAADAPRAQRERGPSDAVARWRLEFYERCAEVLEADAPVEVGAHL